MKFCWRSGLNLLQLTWLFFYILCRKDTRNVTVSLLVEIIAAVPPIMDIECADPLLCLVGEGGRLFINPTSRLAVKAQCTVKGNSDCSSLAYEWYIRPEGNDLAIMKNTDKSLFCRKHHRDHCRPGRFRLCSGLPGQSLQVWTGSRHQHKPFPAVPPDCLHPGAEGNQWTGRHWNITTKFLCQWVSIKWFLFSPHEWHGSKVKKNYIF